MLKKIISQVYKGRFCWKCIYNMHSFRSAGFFVEQQTKLRLPCTESQMQLITGVLYKIVVPKKLLQFLVKHLRMHPFLVKLPNLDTTASVPSKFSQTFRKSLLQNSSR